MIKEQTIIEKYEINPNQRLDVFYNNGEVWLSESGMLSVIHCGEMRAEYQDETLRTSSDFIKAGLDTDEKVRRADENEELYWIYNPWFIVANRDEPEFDYFICGDIVEAIDYALELEKEGK